MSDGKLTVTIDTSAFAYPSIPVPSMWTVRSHVPAPVLEDPAGAAGDAVRELFADQRLRPGASVAVGVGSRGIANLQPIIRAVIAGLKGHGCLPFIVPAMGSHGGATADGQAGILASYGITEAEVGAPVRATMEADQIGSLDDGYPIYCDRNAREADAVVVVNRVKHHTDFHGDIESGLCKMCAIGLGKRRGADAIHRFGADGLRHIMPEVGRRVVANTNVVGGVAIIENPYGATAEIHCLTAAQIGQDAERELLRRSRQLSPRLAFDDLDVLIVDQMGKDISGSGLDTHILGRVRMPSIDETEWDGPRVRIVCVLDITDRSHGNAAGLGLADIVTRRLIERVDFGATATNHRTSGEGGVYRGGIPIVLDSAAMCVSAAMGLCGRGDVSGVRVARIRSTAFVDTLEVSAALLPEVEARADLELVSGPHLPDFGTLLGDAQ